MLEEGTAAMWSLALSCFSPVMCSVMGSILHPGELKTLTWAPSLNWVPGKGPWTVKVTGILLTILARAYWSIKIWLPALYAGHVYRCGGILDLYILVKISTGQTRYLVHIRGHWMVDLLKIIMEENVKGEIAQGYHRHTMTGIFTIVGKQPSRMCQPSSWRWHWVMMINVINVKLNHHKTPRTLTP